MSDKNDVRRALFRAAGTTDKDELCLTSKSAAGYYVSLLMKDSAKGYAYVLLLDRDGRVKKAVCIKRGDGCTDLVREIEKALSGGGFTSFIVVHNHLGNPTTPSSEDEAVTDYLREKYTSLFAGHYVTSDFDYTFIN
ncbi:MAG: JAB domain-containing protein [Clostridia bacterium]|nr:JAB domain-containing protein [Clostridia bacterium]